MRGEFWKGAQKKNTEPEERDLEADDEEEE
jgi:hypothetical protein